MAYCVQHPEVPAEVALAFTGAQGSGKGVVWRCVGNLFAPHFQHFSDPNQFTGKFNAELGKSVFVFLDEAIWGGNKQVGGKIKAMITEPTLQIEFKGIDRKSFPNRLSIVASSNEDWAVPVELGDRRWGVFRANDRYANKTVEHDPALRKERDTYFGALYEQMEKGGQAAMLYDLLTAPTEMWIEAILQSGEIPFAAAPWSEDGLLVSKNSARQSYLYFCKEHSIKRPKTENAWAKTLCKIFGEALNPEYGKPRKYKFGPLEECRELFDKHVGNTPGGEHWAPLPKAASERDWKPRVIQSKGELEEELADT
jgi:hypothetical protein